MKGGHAEEGTRLASIANETPGRQGRESGRPPVEGGGVAARVKEAPGGLFKQALDISEAVNDAVAVRRLDQFLVQQDSVAALRIWCGIPSPRRLVFSKEELLNRLSSDIADLDALLNEQLNAILHHPRFQRLEASWRGLRYLYDQCRGAEGVKLRVLNLSWKELAGDLQRAIEFDQSKFFNKIYNEEFGSPGGEPFGVILGDYEIRLRSSAEHPVNDLDVLESLSHVSAAAFVPMIMGAHPAFFGLDSFAQLGTPLNLPRTFQQTEYLKWRSFRDSEDARFLGLVLPRVLMRLPYEDLGGRSDAFRFVEEVSGPDSSRYLWGTAVYAFGSVLSRAFSQSGWPANIQGVERGVETGGLVTGLPLHGFNTDLVGVANKYSTDVLITDTQEKELGELGFIPLCYCKDTRWCAFYGSASIQKPKVYDEVAATVNARLSAMLQYMFCVSRFAHYLKIIGRDRVGSFATAQQCETYLQRWLLNYTIDADDATLDTKARAPLREGKVEVREKPGKPGSFNCVMHLRPHFQLDQVVTSIKLVTEITPGAG
ncbi:MAG: type VI secretion system contractile sheath large subunit [Chromatiales bacterium]|jgi:type VI secretion system protein ImpD